MTTATAAPVYSFTSHIDGRNARVNVYPTHIEWAKPQTGVVGLVLLGLLALCTCGLSLIAKAARPRLRPETASILLRTVTGVSTNGDGMHTAVTITAPGIVIVGRMGADQAEAVKAFILQAA